MAVREKPISWLPIDSRLLAFGHVHGMARLFLQMEIVLSLLIVTGAIIVTCLRLSSLGR